MSLAFGVRKEERKREKERKGATKQCFCLFLHLAVTQLGVVPLAAARLAVAHLVVAHLVVTYYMRLSDVSYTFSRTPNHECCYANLLS